MTNKDCFNVTTSITILVSIEELERLLKAAKLEQRKRAKSSEVIRDLGKRYATCIEIPYSQKFDVYDFNYAVREAERTADMCW